MPHARPTRLDGLLVSPAPTRHARPACVGRAPAPRALPASPRRWVHAPRVPLLAPARALIHLARRGRGIRGGLRLRLYPHPPRVVGGKGKACDTKVHHQVGRDCW
jgi:hypothetical protein